ncbi:MAG TPA: glycoside hydrolase family 125 protein [Longimicrobiales bacterium]
MRSSWEVTGNHYLAFPCVSRTDGGIHCLNVLHRGALGLLEWSGARAPEPGTTEPLLAPEVRVDGRRAVPAELSWERIDHWIPRFHAVLEGDLDLKGTLFAPGGGRDLVAGAVYRLEVGNRGRVEREVEVALGGTWRWSLRHVMTARAIDGLNRVATARESPALILELPGALSPAALVILAGHDDARCAVAAGEGEWSEPARGAEAEFTAANGEPLRIRIARTIRVPAGRRVSVDFYLAAAVERDGALARAATLRRAGAESLLRATRLNLAQMARRAREPALGTLLNRNLIFNAFFSVGRALDDDRLYPVVSRSPLCPECAVFRERDALLWSLPALLLADETLAREVLLRAYEQFSHHPGAAAHYIDGGVVSPAFALDQYCAYVLALDGYVRATGDETILDEPIVGEVLRDLDDWLVDRLHPEILLAATELLPSGDPALHPYVTYDNVLVWAFCDALDRVWRGAQDPRFARNAEPVAAAIWRYCTAEVDGLRVLAWSTDLEGAAAIYDDPHGSLMLLPHLGFCDVEDPIWANTAELLHSARYPLRLSGRRYPGQASRVRPDEPSLAALCFELLGPRRDEALDVLRRLTLDGDVASTTYDADTGATASGPHHAAIAGLLAWTLQQATGW